MSIDVQNLLLQILILVLCSQFVTSLSLIKNESNENEVENSPGAGKWLAELVQAGATVAQNETEMSNGTEENSRFMQPRPLIPEAFLRQIRDNMTPTQVTFLSLMDRFGTARWTNPSCMKLILCWAMRTAPYYEKRAFHARIFSTLSLLER